MTTASAYRETLLDSEDMPVAEIALEQHFLRASDYYDERYLSPARAARLGRSPRSPRQCIEALDDVSQRLL